MIDEWPERIRLALQSGSEGEMRQAHSDVLAELGPTEGGRVWLEVISGWDSSAVTG
jgi:hypothetical protein